jgi:predicted extracellular nuclease
VKVDGNDGAPKVIVFVVHLKSKRPMIDEGADPDDPLQIALGSARSLLVRTAEATALRHILVDTMRGNTTPVIVLGDINDSVTAVTSEIVSGTPPYKRLPTAKKAAIWDVLLYNVKDLQSRVSYQDTYYTHIFNGYHESLDHIFVSNAFVRADPEHRGYVEYVKVLNDHLIDETLSNQDVPMRQSDHGHGPLALSC